MFIYNYTTLDTSLNDSLLILNDNSLNDSSFKINNKVYNCDIKKPTIDILVNIFNEYYEKFEFKNDFNIYLTGSFLSNSHNTTRNIDILISSNNSSEKNYDKIYNCLYFITNIAMEKYNIIIRSEYYDNLDNFDNHYHNLYNTYDISNNINTITNIINLFKSYGENLTYINYIERRSSYISDLFIISNYNCILDPSYHIIKNIDTNKLLYSLNFDASFINYNYNYLFKDILKINEDSTHSYNEHYFKPILLFNGNNYNTNILDFSNNKLIFYNSEYLYNY